ncbi:MAG: KamA family radical SAM protein [Candidatus Aminicenantes bacterium]|nr:MAG: KamA family radical SAM protein [Candidatus Aminicenantes bacterium]
MTSINNPSHPMYVPEENRKIARDRAKKYIEMISDYLEVKDKIPTGFNRWDQIKENKKKILKILGGSEKDWADWKWQLAHTIRDTGTLAEIISLTSQEIRDIEKTATQYRWSISPHFASLMHPGDINCPIRKQGVPTVLEYLDEEEIKDPYAIVYNSPAPLITRLYADRLIINATNMCSVFCRHCLRKKDIALKDQIYPKEDVQAALDYIASSPEIRDVLITGGDALILSDDYLDWLLTQLDNIPHLEIKRLGSRMISTLPQRVTPGLCEVLSRHQPLYLNTQFNHPLEVNPDSGQAVDRLIRAGVLVGNQSVLLRGINNDKNVMKKLVHELLKIRVRPYYIFNCKKLQGIRHFRAPVGDGMNIMEHLRGYTSGLAVPTFIITAPEGKGKTPMAPTYLLNHNKNGKILFRTWGGYVCEYDDELPQEE